MSATDLERVRVALLDELDRQDPLPLHAVVEVFDRVAPHIRASGWDGLRGLGAFLDKHYADTFIRETTGSGSIRPVNPRGRRFGKIWRAIVGPTG